MNLLSIISDNSAVQALAVIGGTILGAITLFTVGDVLRYRATERFERLKREAKP